jgi:hypothetical protein
MERVVHFVGKRLLPSGNGSVPMRIGSSKRGVQLAQFFVEARRF